MKRKVNGFQPLLCTLLFTCTPAIPMPGYFEMITAGSVSNVNTSDSHLQVSDIETDTLKKTNGSHWNSWGGQLGAGAAYFLHNAQRYADIIQWFPMVEPEVNIYYSTYKNNGHLQRFLDNTPYTQLDYNMLIHSTRLMLDAALTVVSWQNYSAYIIGGIGNAWNRIDYTDADATCDVDGLSLGSNNSNFVWEIGVGAAYAISDTFRLSFQYLYTDFGKVTTGDNGFISGASFNLHTQALLLGLHLSV